jgi:translation elongation factor EF-4
MNVFYETHQNFSINAHIDHANHPGTAYPVHEARRRPAISGTDTDTMDIERERGITSEPTVDRPMSMTGEEYELTLSTPRDMSIFPTR